MVADLAEIERDFIDKGNLVEAAEVWQFKLFERQYHAMKEKIAKELHYGMGFCASAESLVETLAENRRPRPILQLVKAYAAQTNLPFNPEY